MDPLSEQCSNIGDFLEHLDRVIDSFEKGPKEKQITPEKLLRFLDANETFFFGEKVEAKMKQKAFDKLQTLDRLIQGLEGKTEGAKLTHEKIQKVIAYSFVTEKIPIDIQMEIFLSLPASSDEEIQASLQTIDKAIPKISSKVLGQWVSANQIPISKLGLSSERLKKIAPWITYLDLRDYQETDRLLQTGDFHNIFRNLKHLKITNQTVVTLPALPDNLEELDLSWCTSLQKLPDPLPSKLRVLNCNMCSVLKSLPEHLPDTLERLDCNLCSVLLHFPEQLPNRLVFLDCSRCYFLKELPKKLPDSLQTLDCGWCKKLTGLPRLPDRLKSLNYKNCSFSLPPEAIPKNCSVSS